MTGVQTCALPISARADELDHPIGREELERAAQELVPHPDEEVLQTRSPGARHQVRAFLEPFDGLAGLERAGRLAEAHVGHAGQQLREGEDRPGQRDLVLVRLKAAPTNSVTTLIAEPDTQFDAPKWSPDGRTVAVERHRLGRMPEIVLVDVATTSVRVLAAAPRMRFAMPE